MKKSIFFLSFLLLAGCPVFALTPLGMESGLRGRKIKCAFKIYTCAGSGRRTIGYCQGGELSALRICRQL